MASITTGALNAEVVSLLYDGQEAFDASPSLKDIPDEFEANNASLKKTFNQLTTTLNKLHSEKNTEFNYAVTYLKDRCTLKGAHELFKEERLQVIINIFTATTEDEAKKQVAALKKQQEIAAKNSSTSTSSSSSRSSSSSTSSSSSSSKSSNSSTSSSFSPHMTATPYSSPFASSATGHPNIPNETPSSTSGRSYIGEAAAAGASNPISASEASKHLSEQTLMRDEWISMYDRLGEIFMKGNYAEISRKTEALRSFPDCYTNFTLPIAIFRLAASKEKSDLSVEQSANLCANLIQDSNIRFSSIVSIIQQIQEGEKARVAEAAKKKQGDAASGTSTNEAAEAAFANTMTHDLDMARDLEFSELANGPYAEALCSRLMDRKLYVDGEIYDGIQTQLRNRFSTSTIGFSAMRQPSTDPSLFRGEVSFNSAVGLLATFQSINETLDALAKRIAFAGQSKSPLELARVLMALVNHNHPCYIILQILCHAANQETAIAEVAGNFQEVLMKHMAAQMESRRKLARPSGRPFYAQNTSTAESGTKGASSASSSSSTSSNSSTSSSSTTLSPPMSATPHSSSSTGTPTPSLEEDPLKKELDGGIVTRSAASSKSRHSEPAERRARWHSILSALTETLSKKNYDEIPCFFTSDQQPLRITYYHFTIPTIVYHFATCDQTMMNATEISKLFVNLIQKEDKRLVSKKSLSEHQQTGKISLENDQSRKKDADAAASTSSQTDDLDDSDDERYSAPDPRLYDGEVSPKIAASLFANYDPDKVVDILARRITLNGQPRAPLEIAKILMPLVNRGHICHQLLMTLCSTQAQDEKYRTAKQSFVNEMLNNTNINLEKDLNKIRLPQTDAKAKTAKTVQFTSTQPQVKYIE